MANVWEIIDSIEGGVNKKQSELIDKAYKFAEKAHVGQKRMSADPYFMHVFETAKIAGLMAAKSTPQIIPLCHPLQLNKVSIDFQLNHKEHTIGIMAEIICLGQTGVEMEALVAVSAATLTIYDMMKWKDHSMVISDVRLEYKSGGKSGTFSRNGKS